MYFAALTLPELVPIFTLFAGMLGGFYAIAKMMLSQATKDRDSDREERKALIETFDRVAIATEKSADEAKERNGHLGDQNVQIVKLVTAQNKDVADIKHGIQSIDNTLGKSAVIAAEDRDLLTSSPQHVDQQVVHNQVVESKE